MKTRERWWDEGLYCVSAEESGFLCPPDFCQACQGSCHCSHCCQPPVPPASVCVLFPGFLVMATCYVSSPPHRPSSSLRSPSSPPRRLVFSPPCKVILQVEVGHLEACGLAVDWYAVFSLNPRSPQGTEAQGALEAQRGGRPASPHRIRPPPGRA